MNPKGFQSTLPWWERRFAEYSTEQDLLFQSTLPWWERRFMFRFSWNASLVSIHARVVGATITMMRCMSPCRVSIHAPVVGATITMMRCMSPCRVSIHAPVVGATSSSQLRTLGIIVFQSTLPWWERPVSCFVYRWHSKRFNPRSRGGSDTSSICIM